MFYNCITKHKTAKPKYPKSWISFGSGFLVTCTSVQTSDVVYLAFMIGWSDFEFIKKGTISVKKESDGLGVYHLDQKD